MTSTDRAMGPESTVTTGISQKGLRAGAVGVIGAVVIGVSTIAPAYTLTASLGPTVLYVHHANGRVDALGMATT